MFRRRSSSRHQPLNPTPSASAQSAASHAFLAHQASTNSLSSAAAAAALRSHTPPPTSVENVQTKRMLQRRASTASLSRGGHPGLRRSSSSCSMTTRTFRDQSPRRPMTSSGGSSAPPVPPLPQGLPHRTGSERRSMSLQPTMRAMSPPTSRPSGRGGSLDRGPSTYTGRPSHHGAGNFAEQDRPNSRTSINFSYPMNARLNSPRQSPVQFDSPSRQRSEPPSTRPLSADGIGTQCSVSNATSQNVKTKPETVAPGVLQGSHLAGKTTGSRPIGTALDGLSIDSPEDKAEATQFSTSGLSSDMRTTHGESHWHPDQKEELSLGSPEEQNVGHGQVDIDGASGDYAGEYDTVRPRPKKRPSTVMEDHEGEERAEAADNTGEDTGRGFTDHVVPTVTASASGRLLREPVVLLPSPVIDNRSASPVQQSPSSPSASSSPSADRLSAEGGTEQQLQQRQPSISPNRSTRFSAQLTVTGPNAPLHEPPPRSMSPAKPALKNSSQPSLSPDRRGNTALRAPSPISDGTSVVSDDGSRSGSRKKTAKVSFDDEAEIVGVAASPPTSPDLVVAPPSPPEKNKTKPHWFPFGKKTSGFKEFASDDDFDSVLKPRPALPSFGSIRGNREVGEEEPVAETVSDNESTVSSLGNLDAVGIPLSSDHAIGGILANARDELPKHLHAHSNPLNEPIPLQVTSIEGTGNKSGSEESRSGAQEVAMQPILTVQEEKGAIPATGSTFTSSNVPDTAAPGSTKELAVKIPLSEPIPVIEVQPATPAPSDHRISLEIQRMPGGFPSSPERADNQSATNKREVVQPSPLGGSSETPRTSNVTSGEDSDKESGDSIYSDAAEDPAELEGDGFGSINAIVAGPIPVKTGLPTQPPDSPTRLQAQKIAGFAVAEPNVSSAQHRPAAYKTSDSAPEVREPAPQPVRTVSGEREDPPPSGETTQQEHETEPTAFDSPYPPWPLKPRSTSSTSPPADSNLKRRNTSTSPQEGSHLRSALGVSEGQRTNSVNRYSMAASRVSSAPPSHKRTISAGLSQNRNTAGTAPGRQAATKAPRQSADLSSSLGRTRSNGSDSSSSFKRSRRSFPSDSQVTMKRTLRGGETRSLSAVNGPVERPMSPRASTMRTTLRGTGPSEQSSIFAGLSKGSRSRARPKSSSFRSRFQDSDEEADEGRPRRHKSRFADSSDEDEPLSTQLRPVRGIPRRAQDGDSTDLDDSSDEEGNRAGQTGRDQAEVSRPQSGPRMTQDKLEEFLSQPKKRGLLARLTSTKKKSRFKDGKVRKSDLDSAARRDTPLEQSRVELEQMKGEDYFLNGYGAHTVTTVTAHPRPTSLKLQKRKTREDASWPLQATGPSNNSQGLAEPNDQTPLPDGVPGRPQTSDGVVNHDDINRAHAGPEEDGGSGWSTRFSKLNGRRDTNSSIASKTASDVVVGRNGRKKRFPLLRKAFGLRD
ncbi:hypothetical protein VTN77DRAFT_2825 [Rasamsonia byssochlamydoides]|uniref:uncharacterized protein n=1 Tax=Rasamsonia byssochlamydoides TaxID=89139 RepID=UPI0037438AF6